MNRRLKRYSLVMIFVMLLSVFGPNLLGIYSIRGENLSTEAEQHANVAITSAQDADETTPAPVSEEPLADVTEEVPVVPEAPEEPMPEEPPLETPVDIPEDPPPIEEPIETPPQDVEEPVPEESAEEVPPVSELTPEEPVEDPADEELTREVIPFANAQPGDETFYTADDSIGLTVNIADTSSTNGHTRSGLIWVGPDQNLYFAIRSTHELTSMTLSDGENSVTVLADEDEPDALVFPSDALIYLDSVSYHPNMAPELSGNTEDAHWTVFRLPLSALNLSPEDNAFGLTVLGIGRGHDLIDAPIIISVNVTPTTTTISVQKILEGRDWMDDDSFTFNLTGEVDGETITRTATIVDDQDVNFAPITFTAAGEYEFTVTEVVGAIPGITYDEEPKTVTVVVTYDAATGILSVVNPEALIFTNTYTPEPVYVEIPVQKILEGRDWMDDDSFTFNLTGEVDGETITRTATIVDDQDVNFAPITFTAAGEYAFTVTEVVGAIPGITYDEEPKTVTVVVTYDAATGILSVVNPEALIFTNTYTPKPVDVEIPVQKILEGRDWMDSDSFTFNLTGEVDGETITRTATIVDDQDVNFAPITFTAAGEYAFTVTEVVGTIPGITYDEEPKTVTVVVTYDAATGILSVVNPEALIFTNSYSATGEWAPDMATKALAGRDLKMDEFKFELVYEDTVLQTVGNLEDGRILFTPIVFDQTHAGMTYTYLIREVVPSEDDQEGGMTYDPLVIEVVLTVNDGGDGTLEFVVADIEDTVFNNTYEAENGYVIIGAKLLDGRDLAADEFSFELKDEAGTVLQTKTNAADGTIGFDNLVFNQDDIGETFRYTISEIAGTETGMVYSDLLVNLEITVTDAGNGELLLDAVMDAAPIFINTYEASGSYTLDVEKVLTGRDLVADEFQFELLDAQGLVIETVRNQADGTVPFAPITFDESHIGQTFNFTVREIQGANGNVEYDATEYVIKLFIEDAGNGDLRVTRVDGANDPGIVFNNTWKTVNVTGTKKWVGGPEAKPVVWFKLQRAVAGNAPTDVPGAAILELDGITEVTWPNLEVNTDNGEAYIYSVVEVNADGENYVPSDYEKVEEGLIVTNTYIETPAPTTKPTDPAPTTKPTDPAPIAKTGGQAPLTWLGGTLVLGAITIFLLRRRRETTFD